MRTLTVRDGKAVYDKPAAAEAHAPKAKPKTRIYSLHLLSRQLVQLHAVRETSGIAIAEQIRRGIDLWLSKQGAL